MYTPDRSLEFNLQIRNALEFLCNRAIDEDVVWTPATSSPTTTAAWAGIAIPPGTLYALVRPKTVDCLVDISDIESTGDEPDPEGAPVSLPVNGLYKLPVHGNLFLNYLRDGGTNGTLTITWLS